MQSLQGVVHVFSPDALRPTQRPGRWGGLVGNFDQSYRHGGSERTHYLPPLYSIYLHLWA